MAHPQPSGPRIAREYLRVSRDTSGRERSNDEQHADNQRAAETEGWTLGESYRDKGSASRFAARRRDDFDRLVAELEADQFGAEILLLWESSRGSRRLSEWARFLELVEERNVRVHVTSHNRTYDLTNPRDRRTLQEDGTDAEYESGKISSRVKRSTAAGFADGRPHGRRPFGYRRVYDPTTGRSRQEPHPDEAAIVRRVFADYLAGRGIGGIAKDLNNEGIPTPMGRRWMHQSVRRILTSPTYIGRRVHKGQETAGDWPPIIDPAMFEKVKARFEARKGAAQTSTARLLTGVARCGPCGSKIGVIHDPKGRDVYWCRGGHCVTRDLHRLDDYVSGWVLARLAEPEVGEALDGAPDPLVEAARARRAKLHEELGEAMELWRRRDLSVQAYATMERDLLAAIAVADREIQQIIVPLSVHVPAPDRLGAWWEDELTGELRREVVAALIAGVVIHRVGRGNNRTYDVPASTTIEPRR